MKNQLITALALAALSLAAAPALAKTIAVKPGDSIQAAVDSASPGDRIYLRRGVHNEGVTVDVANLARIKFLGQRGAIWDGYNDTSDQHFDILDISDSNNAVVQGITFRNGSTQVVFDSNSTGSKVVRCRSRAADTYFVDSGSDDFKVERNFATGTDSAVFELSGDDNVVRLNRMRYCGCEGISADGTGALIERNNMANMEDGPGICADDDDAIVRRNRLARIGGIGIDGDSDNAIISNNIIQVTYGESIEFDGDDVQVLNNRCTDMGDYGLEITGDDPIVRGNVIVGQFDDEDAVDIDAGSTTATVENNRISDVQEGGFIIECDNGTIRNNRVTNYGNEDDDAAFDITGDGNTITKCVATNGRNDAFNLDGNDNTLTRCTARNIDEDGIVIEGNESLRNTIELCVVTDCAAEGLQNEGLDTVVRNSRFTQSRLDVTNSGTFATFTGNRFTTGSETTEPEVD